MLKVFLYVQRYRVAIAIALCLTFIELAVELLQPFLISKIIDDGIQRTDMAVVLKWGAVMLGCAFIAFTAGIVNSFYAAHVSQSYGYDLREHLYEHIQAFSFPDFNRFPTSSLITRLTNDVTQIQNTIFMSLRIMLRAPLLVIGGVVMSFIVNPRLALILALSVPVLMVFLFWMMNRAGKLFRAVQEKLDHVNGVMQENLAGMRLIKAFYRKRHETARFKRSSGDLMERMRVALRFIELTMPVVLLMMNASVMAILWFGRAEIMTNGASVGEVVAIINYAMRITAALSIFSMIIMNFSRARASAGRVAEVLDVDVTEQTYATSHGNLESDDDDARTGRLVFKDVVFHYPGTSASTLEQISFEVKPGQTVAILGATGSGKTTLFQLIPRLYEIDDGAIEIDHTDIRAMTLDRLRHSIGYVPQEALLFTGSVSMNITWGKEDATKDEIIAAAKRAQIHDTIVQLPNGYDTVLGQRGVNLSGGQKQRLSIARALVRKPQILLLDDSTSALDAKTEKRLLEALKDESRTILMITQKLSAAMGADHILLLDDGKLLEQGNHHDLLKRSSLYLRIYQSQFGEEAEIHVR